MAQFARKISELHGKRACVHGFVVEKGKHLPVTPDNWLLKDPKNKISAIKDFNLRARYDPANDAAREALAEQYAPPPLTATGPEKDFCADEQDFVALFRKKPITIEAKRIAVPCLIKENGVDIPAVPGEWEVEDVDGSSYLLNDADFRGTYDPIDAEAQAMYDMIFESSPATPNSAPCPS